MAAARLGPDTTKPPPLGRARLRPAAASQRHGRHRPRRRAPGALRTHRGRRPPRSPPVGRHAPRPARRSPHRSRTPPGPRPTRWRGRSPGRWCRRRSSRRSPSARTRTADGERRPSTPDRCPLPAARCCTSRLVRAPPPAGFPPTCPSDKGVTYTVVSAVMSTQPQPLPLDGITVVASSKPCRRPSPPASSPISAPASSRSSARTAATSPVATTPPRGASPRTSCGATAARSPSPWI